MKKRITLLAGLLVIAAGVAAGIALAVRGNSGLSPTEARAQFARFESRWQAELEAGARKDPQRRFPTPSRSWLKHQLRDARFLCGCFTDIKVEFIHSVQVAPIVVVQAVDEHALFLRQAAIFDLIDKMPRPGDTKWHSAYEGLLLEARNDAGVPFLASDVFIRGQEYGGGNFWAPGLLPAPTQP